MYFAFICVERLGKYVFRYLRYVKKIIVSEFFAEKYQESHVIITIKRFFAFSGMTAYAVFR
jgi:3-isopropylmalate dehydratase small subunit